VNPTETRFVATPEKGEVSAILSLPVGATSLHVLAHGAGAGMQHPSMDGLSRAYGERGVATFRYHFPYMERGGGPPDRPPILLATVRSAVRRAAETAPGLPLTAGGRSMGGRMTSLAQAEEPIPGVRGLVFAAFPLHPPGNAGTERARHLERITIPMLFLQGTKDAFAELSLLRDVVTGLGDRAMLHLIDGADHSFHVPKRSGRTDADVLAELANVVADWSARIREP
jgi:predicted alpha/beta-hydrolase family hydrolase